jgi:CBS domain-containing protein
MTIRDLMSESVRACDPKDPLSRAASIMWEVDCGSVPVVEGGDGGRVVGIVTDRDICMAAYSQGKSLDEIPVHGCMARQVFFCTPEAAPEEVLETMGKARIRRLPVLSSEGRLVGMVSTADLARAAASESGVGKSDFLSTFARISTPTAAPSESRAPR